MKYTYTFREALQDHRLGPFPVPTPPSLLLLRPNWWRLVPLLRVAGHLLYILIVSYLLFGLAFFFIALPLLLTGDQAIGMVTLVVGFGPLSLIYVFLLAMTYRKRSREVHGKGMETTMDFLMV